jgi:hypothetical protein
MRIEKPIRCVCHGLKGGFSIYSIPHNVKYFWQESGIISIIYVIYDIRFWHPLSAGKINTFVINILVQLHPERQRNENQI